MNTRLQVEHPVTECTTALDLVQWQIRAAAGEPFPYSQEALTQRGHAIECRIYAEDPANGFLPSTGRLLQYIEPRGPGIRVDAGFRRGDEVTHFYDPMLAKLIVHAEDRALAVQKMLRALREYVVHGVTTNLDFLQAVLAHPDFASGRVSTRWVETRFDWKPPAEPSAAALIAAALAEAIAPVGQEVAVRSSSTSHERDPFSPWKSKSGFRN
jgi:acetyl/propionyl-CoA carboxylase alpha subunit